MINLSQIKLDKAEIKAVNQVLKSGQLVQGAQVEKLEKNFVKYCQSKYAVAVNSGTAALHCALYAVGIKPGDEVITTPFTFAATANSILMMGAKPIFADINPETFNILPAEIESKITKKTTAVLSVDLYGQPVDYRLIKKICQKHDLKFIADSCQAVGAEYQGKKIGNIADITAFSLYATKNMMCGEGGMITTNNSQYAKKCQQFRSQGQVVGKRYDYVGLGYNYRLTDVLAAIALEQLKKVEKFNFKRIQNAKYLSTGLVNIKGLITPAIESNNKHVFHQYTLKITPDCKITRKKLINLLLENGIQSHVYYPQALYKFKHFGSKMTGFKNTKKTLEQVLSLPIHPGLKKQDLDFMITIIKKYAQ